MGWWKVEGTEDLVGDHAFDLLREAATAVAHEYRQEFGRAPTRSEWQRLLRNALQPRTIDGHSNESLFADCATALSVEIVVDDMNI